jgi:acetyl esterase
MYMHGGGFTAGSIESIDTTLRNLAKLTGWLVASVEYRLAPEHPYPAAPADCYAAFLHLASRASSLNIDPARIVVAGESAGGLLAAVVALQARDRRGPRLAGFVCLYPLTDLRDQCSYPSMAEHDGNVFHIRDLRGFLNLYLPPGVDRSQATVSPGLAADLSGLPPALIVSCDFDPIRDEGRVFARRLSEAGVAVDAINMPGMIHAVMPLAGLLPEAYAQMITHIRSFLGRHVPAGTSAG